MAAALRAGSDLATAWGRQGVASIDGVPVPADVARRYPTAPELAPMVVAAARLAVVTGAPPAVVLERLALSLAAEAEVAGQRRAAFAGPRATARLLTWLPVFGLCLGVALGVDPVAVLLDGAAGTLLLALGLALTLLGRRWSSHLLAVAAR